MTLDRRLEDLLLVQPHLEDSSLSAVTADAAGLRRAVDAAGATQAEKDVICACCIYTITQSPVLSADDKVDRVVAWCEGFGIDFEEFSRRMKAVMNGQ